MKIRSRGARLCLHIVTVAGTLCAGFIPVSAEEVLKKALPAEAAQFDFMVGEWEVTTPDGKVAGANVLEKILEGRVLLENWTGSGGFVGKSFNIFDETIGKWRQFWVDASGLTLDLSGGMENGSMVLSGERLQDGKPIRDRIRWTPHADGTVRQLWEASEDDGQSWTVVFDGLYRRKS